MSIQPVKFFGGEMGIVLSAGQLILVIALFYSPRLSMSVNPEFCVPLSLIALVGAFRFFPNILVPVTEKTNANGRVTQIKHPGLFVFLICTWHLLIYPYLIFREAKDFDSFCYPYLYFYLLTMGASAKLAWSCLDLLDPFGKTVDVTNQISDRNQLSPNPNDGKTSTFTNAFVAGIAIELAKKEAQKITKDETQKNLKRAG